MMTESRSESEAPGNILRMLVSFSNLTFLESADELNRSSFVQWSAFAMAKIKGNLGICLPFS